MTVELHIVKVVNYQNFPVIIGINTYDDETRDEIIQWCLDSFGDDMGHDKRWQYHTIMYTIFVYLKNDDDIMLTVLTWG